MRFKTVAVLGAAVILAVGAAAFLHHGGSSAALMRHLAAVGQVSNATANNDASAETVRAARTRIAALGKHWSAEVAATTGEIYAELRGSQTDAGIHRTNAIHYGPDPAQTLDLFIPDGGFNELSTVLVYLHGDALAPSADNVGAWIANVGGIGVLARYRGGPKARWPTGAEDVRLLLKWVHANIQQHGGDPRLIVLMGNSTGATHIAEYLFDAQWQLPDGPGVAAAVLSSGVFDASFGADLQFYYEGAADSVPRALVDRYQGRAVPIMLWSAQYDPPAVQAGVAELFAKLCRKRSECPAYERLAGANHVSHILSIGSADTAATEALFRFYHTTVN